MIQLSARAEILSKQNIIQPQLIVEIDGLPILSATDLFIIPKVGDTRFYVGYPGMKVGWPLKDPDTKNLINVKGSTNNITQQLLLDKGQANSVTSITIEVVDKDGILTRYLSPGVLIEDLLSKKANVYLNMRNGAHPEDSSPVLYGVVDDISAGATSVKIKISHPDGLKRQDIFTQIQGETLSQIRYRYKVIQGIAYQTQDAVGNPVTIKYTAGGSAGSEAVSVSGTAITVLIASGTSTAENICNAIGKSQAAVNLVKVNATEGNSSLVQTAFGSPIVLDSTTTIDLDGATGLLLPSADGTFETYIRVEDEIIKYTGISDDTLTGCEGAQFGSIGRTHEAGQNFTSFYRIKGEMKDIALKLMLSKGPELSGIKPISVVFHNASNSIPNAFFFQGVDAAERFGLTAGDFASSSGSVEAANNFTGRTIVSIQSTDIGSYIIVDGAPLTLEREATCALSFKSKYDVWPDGLAMQLDQVDVEKHETLSEFFPAGFFEYDFFLKDTITGDKFLSEEVYYPSGCYAIPRKGRSSVSITLPPLAQGDAVVLDERNVLNLSKLTIRRSLNQYFYNAVVYKYDEDAVDDKFTAGAVTFSERSLSRVKNVTNKPLLIESKGMRASGDTKNSIANLTQRFLERFQYGAEVIEVEVLYSVGYPLDVGDTVIFGGPNMKISDSTLGTRKFQPRVMEVINKSLGVTSGKVSLTLLNTAFSVDSKYGVIAPSSYVDSGSTTLQIKIKKMETTPAAQLENYKWIQYVGQKILIHSADWTFAEETTLKSFSESNPNVMNVYPPLSIAPGEDFIVDPPVYPAGTNAEENIFWKRIHCFFSPTVPVVSQPAANKIEVSAGDIGLFHVDSPVRIHTRSYSSDTGDIDLSVESIAGNVLTLSKNLDLSVDSTFEIDLIGFPDLGAPYRIL